MKSLFKRRIFLAVIFIIIPILFLASMSIGPYPASFKDIILFLTGNSAHALCEAALQLRFNRILMAAAAGAGLAVSGAVLQGLFRNPLVDSGLMGINSGAGFGAAAAIVFLGGSGLMVQVSSLAFALFALVFCFLISRWYRDRAGVILVLAGVVISSLFSSLLTLLKFTADPFDKLPRIIYWLMGSFSNIEKGELVIAWIAVLLSTFILYLLRWRLNVISMGADSAHSVGVSVRLVTVVSALLASLIAAVIISCCGVIGWAGLIVPHIARMITGNDNRSLLPFSFLIGLILMVAADSLTRLSGIELPVTIITSLMGVPFYIFLLRRYRQQAGGSYV